MPPYRAERPNPNSILTHYLTLAYEMCVLSAGSMLIWTLCFRRNVVVESEALEVAITDLSDCGAMSAKQTEQYCLEDVVVGKSADGSLPWTGQLTKSRHSKVLRTSEPDLSNRSH